MKAGHAHYITKPIPTIVHRDEVREKKNTMLKVTMNIIVQCLTRPTIGYSNSSVAIPVQAAQVRDHKLVVLTHGQLMPQQSPTHQLLGVAFLPAFDAVFVER